MGRAAGRLRSAGARQRQRRLRTLGGAGHRPAGAGGLAAHAAADGRQTGQRLMALSEQEAKAISAAPAVPAKPGRRARRSVIAATLHNIAGTFEQSLFAEEIAKRPGLL